MRKPMPMVTWSEAAQESPLPDLHGRRGWGAFHPPREPLKCQMVPNPTLCSFPYTHTYDNVQFTNQTQEERNNINNGIEQL